jgi:hypothetical protein
MCVRATRLAHLNVSGIVPTAESVRPMPGNLLTVLTIYRVRSMSISRLNCRMPSPRIRTGQQTLHRQRQSVRLKPAHEGGTSRHYTTPRWARFSRTDCLCRCIGRCRAYHGTIDQAYTPLINSLLVGR